MGKKDKMKVFVVGDLHGDYESFKKAIEYFDQNKREGDVLVFLGDYADRGPNGVEIVTELFKILKERKDIIALKGNHEDYTKEGNPKFWPCDLRDEADKKVAGGWNVFWKEVFQPFLQLLEQAYIAGKVLFVHGGISSKIKSRADIFKKENEEILLWSDPFDGEGEELNPRGAGVEFGMSTTKEVLKNLDLELIIRSHQPNKASDGKPCFEHDGKVVTINSSSVYGMPFMLIVDTNKPKIEKIIKLKEKVKVS